MIKKLALYGFVFLIIGCTAKKQTSQSIDEDRELEFYNIFTEATKNALLGNFKSALSLYQICIANYPEKAAPYYQISNIYLTVKDVPKSKKYAKAAVDIDDNNKWYLIHLANLYQYENNVDSVIYLYEKIIKLTPDPEYKYNLAVFYSSKGDIKKSMEIVTSLEKEYDGMREIILMKHKNFDALNETDSAIYQLETLVKLFPDEFENYGLLAEYLSEINRFDYAREIYGELLEIEPDNGLANVSYGDFYLKQGKKDSALVYYKKGFNSKDIRIEDKIGILFNYIYDPVAIKADSLFIEELLITLKNVHKEDDRPYTLAAEYFVKKQNYEKALLELEQAIEFDAEAYVVWEQYIMISNYLGKYENVSSIYEKATDKFPDKVKLFIFSAYSLYELKEYDKSIEISRKASDITDIALEDKVQTMNQMADSYRGLEQYDTSDSIYEEILLIDPENLLIRNNYSYYLSVRNINLDRAEELSRLTIKKEPKNSTYLDTYGWILYMQDNYKEALKYIEAAIKNGAYNNAEVLEHYGDVVYKLNRCSDAIEAWEESLKYNLGEQEEIKRKINDAKDLCQ